MSDPSAAIRMESLGVRLGGHLVLEDLNVTVESGAFVSIIGPNGAGKTSLLKTILGLIPVGAGRLRINGRTPEGLPTGEIGYVPQFKTLNRSFPGTAIELVASGLKRRWPGRLGKADRERAEAMLLRVKANHLEGRSITRLSGGELQRVYLARALVSRPGIILLDEPATGIDVVGELDMYRLLEDYQKESGATVMMITHDLNAVCHLCSHVLLLNRRQIGYGPSAEVLSDENMRRVFGHVGHDHPMWVGGMPHA